MIELTDSKPTMMFISGEDLWLIYFGGGCRKDGSAN